MLNIIFYRIILHNVLLEYLGKAILLHRSLLLYVLRHAFAFAHKRFFWNIFVNLMSHKYIRVVNVFYFQGLHVKKLQFNPVNMDLRGNEQNKACLLIEGQY